MGDRGIKMQYGGVAVLLLLLCTSCTADSASKIAKLRQQLAEAEAEAAVQISETSAGRLPSNSSWIPDPEKSVLITVLIGLATLLWWLKRPGGPTEPPQATLPYTVAEQRAIDDERKDMTTELERLQEESGLRATIRLSHPSFDQEASRLLQSGHEVLVDYDIKSRKLHSVNPLLEVKEFNHKGRGYVAKEYIPQGTLLLDETGLRLRASNTKQQVAAVVLDKELFDFLSPCGLKRCAHKVPFVSSIKWEDWMRGWQLCAANMFASLDLPGSQGLVSIFREASLFNHSCVPNAWFAIAANGRIHVVSERDIKPGEEVCIDYWPTGGGPQGMFECQCKKCLTGDSGQGDNLTGAAAGGFGGF